MSRFQSYLVSTLLVMILSDFHSEGAHTKDPFPANDESSKPDTKHSLKVCQVADLALQMSTNKARPFPPPSTFTGTAYPRQSAIGTPPQYSIVPAPRFIYPPRSTFAQNFLCTFPDTPDLSPQSFPVRSLAKFLPHSTIPPRRPSAHDPPHQPIQVPARTDTTFQMSQVQDTRMPVIASSPPPAMVQAMQMPDPRNNIRHAPRPYSNYTSQAHGMSYSPSQRGEGMLGAAQNAPLVCRNRTSVPYSHCIHALSDCLFDLSRGQR